MYASKASISSASSCGQGALSKRRLRFQAGGASRPRVSRVFLRGPDLVCESEAGLERVGLRRVDIRLAAELLLALHLFEMHGSELVQLLCVVLCGRAWSRV